MKAVKHKKKTIFGKILLGFVVLAMIGIICLWIRLWHYLEDYQQTLPAQIGEDVLHDYQSFATPSLRSLCTNLPSALQDDFAYQHYLHQIIDAKDMYYYESDRDEKEGTITYTYTSKGREFAVLTIKKTSETSSYGFPIYKTDRLEQLSLANYDFYEPAGTTIYLDGKPIDASCLVDQTAVADTFTELDIGPFYDKHYTVPDNLAMGTVTATDLNGSPCQITWDDAHLTCTVTQTLSDEIAAPVKDFALQSAKTYAAFATIKNASREGILSKLCPDSNLYTAIKSYDNSWGIAATADVFSNEQIINCTQYSSDAFTCEVSFDYTVTQRASEKVYPLHFLLSIVNQDGNLQILNLETL